jgi:penicillin-binding protein 2
MLKGIYRSCDVYFYDVAKRIGIDRISDMAKRFGFGEKLKLGLPGEQPGLVPTREWKLAVHGTRWQQGETLIAGIGQGFLLATPLQLAVMVARIANGGYAVTPRLVRSARPAQVDDQPDDGPAGGDGAASLGLNPRVLAFVRQGMKMVTNHNRGTAYAARIKREGWEMAGKTGTAQVRRISKQERQSGIIKNEEKPWAERDHAMFVAYAPADKPRYAIAVVVEHGGGGSKVAAPIARDILIETQRLDPVGRPGRERFAGRGAGLGAGLAKV